jgi:hypothetical protein
VLKTRLFGLSASSVQYDLVAGSGLPVPVRHGPTGKSPPQHRGRLTHPAEKNKKRVEDHENMTRKRQEKQTKKTKIRQEIFGVIFK